MKYLPILVLMLTIISCNQKPGNNVSDKISQVEATTIEVELTDSTSLFILLAKDGTINRKGDLKTRDKNFFMGMTQEKLFDSLMLTINKDLPDYFGRMIGVADTTQSINKVKLGFGGPGVDTGIEYYSKESLDKLPQPIKEFIDNAIRITDPWFETQQKMVEANKH